MFSLHYLDDKVQGLENIETYSIYHNEDKKFLSFATVKINRTGKMIYFSNFDNLSIDMRRELYKLIRESKDELDIEGYKVSPFYSGYSSYLTTYATAYI